MRHVPTCKVRIMPTWPVPYGMIIVSSFSLNLNLKTEIFVVESTEIIDCPLCGGTLKYRDRITRNKKGLSGKVSRFSLRRLKCQQCNRYHRELPNIIQPFKHYDSQTIQYIIDGSTEAEQCAAEDSTIRRWKTTFAESTPDISMRLTSAWARMSGEKVPIENAEMILDLIRGREKHWLAFVMALLINGGHAPRTRFAFCPAEFSVKVNEKIKKGAKGGEKIDKTNDDSS